MVKKTFSYLNLWHSAFQDYMLMNLAAEGQLSKYFYSEDHLLPSEIGYPLSSGLDSLGAFGGAFLSSVPRKIQATLFHAPIAPVL